MMGYWGLILCVVILLTVAVGLLRIWKGPTRADRMLAGQLAGSASVAILLLFGYTQKKAYMFDIALLFALLAAVAVVVFVRFAWQQTGEES